MTYVEGFLTPVPDAKRDAYVAHSNAFAPLILEFGATRHVEAWGSDVPRGEVNDMWGAVQAGDGESVVFSWIEYPDRATRDAAVERMMADPRMEELGRDMPFDGKRMMYGGFRTVSDAGDAPGRIVDGVVMPVRDLAGFERLATTVAPAFLAAGATRCVDAIADDVKDGEVTDFNRAIGREGDETAGFGWVEWPDRATRDAGWERVMADPAMHPEGDGPFAGKRMIFGLFDVVVDTRG